MKKALICVGLIVLFSVPAIYVAAAESETPVEQKQEIAADKQVVKDQAVEMKEDASVAKQEEQQLREQIVAARQAGDMETAKNLEEQLKAMHGANVQEKKQDKQEMKAAKQEVKQEIKEARIEGNLPPKGQKKSNNPPGPKGGPGTNWNNPPGPKGGPGASQRKK